MIRRGTFAAAALVWFFIPACAGSPDPAAPTAIAQGSTGSANAPVTVSGAVDRLSGTAASFAFFVGAREVRGNSQTQFSAGSSFTTLKNGQSVEAHGPVVDNVLAADRVAIAGENDHGAVDDDDDDGDEAELRGSIQSINGTVPNLMLTVAGQTVQTSASTVLRRRGNVVDFDALRVSGEVEVEGRRRADGVLLAQKITLEDDGDEGREVELTGSISGLSAVSACPSITFALSGDRSSRRARPSSTTSAVARSPMGSASSEGIPRGQRDRSCRRVRSRT
jgi:hypothetical protein